METKIEKLWVKVFTVYASIRYMSFHIMVRTVSIG